MPVRVRFVAAAGPSIGRGHLARALALGEAAWGADPALELELLEGSLTEREASRAAAAALRIVAPGSPVQRDAAVVVDLPVPHAVAGRFEPARLTVFDDRESFLGRAALVVQPSMPSWDGRASAGSVMAGFEFVPVSAAVRRRRGPEQRPADGGRPASTRLLVSFGGSDPDRVTERLAPAIAAAVDAELEVVIGASYSGATDGWPFTPLRDPPDLVERMAAADLVLLGAGTMKFEVACLGRPMLVVAAADDQLRVGPAFAATGAARYLGDGRTIDTEAVVGGVNDLLADPRAREQLGRRAAAVVDGLGADRIAAAVARLGQPGASS
jgi:spore coat polysaccharide biosynthesis predicted glycosyltransferase SpsG